MFVFEMLRQWAGPAGQRPCAPAWSLDPVGPPSGAPAKGRGGVAGAQGAGVCRTAPEQHKPRGGWDFRAPVRRKFASARTTPNTCVEWITWTLPLSSGRSSSSTAPFATTISCRFACAARRCSASGAAAPPDGADGAREQKGRQGLAPRRSCRTPPGRCRRRSGGSAGTGTSRRPGARHEPLAGRWRQVRKYLVGAVFWLIFLSSSFFISCAPHPPVKPRAGFRGYQNNEARHKRTPGAASNSAGSASCRPSTGSPARPCAAAGEAPQKNRGAAVPGGLRTSARAGGAVPRCVAAQCVAAPSGRGGVALVFNQSIFVFLPIRARKLPARSTPRRAALAPPSCAST